MASNKHRSLFLVRKAENPQNAPLQEQASKVLAIGCSGEVVLVGGDYAVHHRAHRLPSTVTLLEGERFPTCEACDEAISFELVEALPALTRNQHPIVLNKLPVMPEAEEDRESLRIAS